VILIAILIFLAVLFLILAVYLNITSLKDSPKADLRRRLRHMARSSRSGSRGIPENLRSDILKETPPLERILQNLPPIRRLDSRIDRSGLDTTVTAFLLATLLLGAGGFIICLFLTSRFLFALLIGVLFMLAPFAYLEAKKHQREIRFTELFPDALSMISRSIRSGHSFTSSVQLVGQEISDPVGSLFKTAYDQQMLGLRINDTLNNLNERIDSLDLRFFTTAVAINSEVGGNFAEILDKLADTIRERIKIKRQLRVHTAQGRMSGYILAVLPIVVFFLMDFMIPGYQKILLNDPNGRLAIIGAIIMQIIGFLVIRRIINIRI
jgi:tight adherence protein B